MNQNKNVINVLLIIIMILVVIGCIVSYLYFVEVDEEENPNILFNIEDYPKVDGSIATLKMAEEFKSKLTGEKTENVNIVHTKTENAYENLINKKVDLILVTYPTEKETVKAQEAGIELEIVPVAKDALIFFTNKDNKVENLTLTQIQDIYSGKITNWRDVGGDDITITPYQRPSTSDSQKVILTSVMQGIKMKEPETQNIDMWKLSNIITDYTNSQGAIGYCLNYYKILYNTEELKFLTVNDVEPTYDNVRTGLYGLQAEYYAVIRKDEPENSNTRKLLNAMTSKYGQNIVKEAGYVQVD